MIKYKKFELEDISKEEIYDNLQRCISEKIDYWYRIQKAIDKVQYIIDYGFDYDGFDNVEDLKGLIDMLVTYARQTKSILRGESDEED